MILYQRILTGIDTRFAYIKGWIAFAKIKKALGLQKMPVSAKEGLACTILSFKK